MKESSSGNFGPARLYIVIGGSVFQNNDFVACFLLFFLSLSYSGTKRAPGGCDPCFTSCNIIPAALLTTFEPVKWVNYLTEVVPLTLED